MSAGAGGQEFVHENFAIMVHVLKRLELLVEEEERRSRLEDFLFDRFPGLSRMYLRDVVRSAACEVNGRIENIGYRLRPNDFIEIELDPTRENAMRPEAVPLDIVFEDPEFVVINKPPGMLVHPTHRDKTGTLLNALSYYLNQPTFEPASGGALLNVRQGGRSFVRPGLVHRLDRQTSGLIVVAKNPRSHRILARQFQTKTVEKRYLALVCGRVDRDEGMISGSIGRFPAQKRWDIKADGKQSETRFRVRERYAERSLLELEPVTGRTNQLRIHCASIGHAIVGDTARNGGTADRLYLHAFHLSFRHPASGSRESFELGPPEEFSKIL